MLCKQDGSGSIDKRELRTLLYDVYGDEPTDRELVLFLAYFDHNADGRISWAEFCAGIRKVVEHMKVQNRTGGKKHLKAPWEVKKAPQVIGPGEVKSSQEMVGGLHVSLCLSAPVLVVVVVAFACSFACSHLWRVGVV